MPQLFAVGEGTGWIRSREPERTPIAAGEAAFWVQGEWHEVACEHGLVAIVVETPHLLPGDGIGSAPDQG